MSLKEIAFDQWRAVLAARRDNLSRNTDAAKSGTRVDGTHRPSNRGERAAVTTAGYLAQGLATRAAELQAHLDAMDEMGTDARSEVAVGALVTVAIDDEPPRTIAVFPGGDATTLDCAVQVLSIRSPLAQGLRDAEPGDVVEVDLGGRIAEVDVQTIA